MHFAARAHSLADVEFLAQAGFELAELDWLEPDLVRPQMGELAALRDRTGIGYLAHGPKEGNPFTTEHHGPVLGPQVDQLLDLAGELGIPLYTQHLWLDARFVPPEILAAKIELLGRWTARARQAGVTLCIENLSEHAAHLAPAFDRIPDLRMTLDLGHGQILAPTRSESAVNACFELIEAYAQHRPRIRHVHLHDNHGGDRSRDDLHLPLGEGCIDFRGILGALHAAGYGGAFSFEIGLEHVERGRELVHEMWGLGPDWGRQGIGRQEDDCFDNHIPL
jgi:sugar phosphate isomerase/epimerase